MNNLDEWACNNDRHMIVQDKLLQSIALFLSVRMVKKG